MIYIAWIGIALYIVIVVGTMLAVLMDRRLPVKTMAWMLVLVFLPVVGIILYFFFGQNTRKERSISRQSLDQLSKRSMLEFVDQKNLKIPEEHRSVISLFSNQGGSMPFTGNRAEIYTDGYGFFPALLAEIARARHHIHLLSYIIEDDPLGRLVSDALTDKVREGVEVRVIYDDVGCWKVKNSFFERMRDEGIEVHPFMPVRFPAFTSKVNYRNHRKICVIDGSVGFIGGMNIALRYVKGTHSAWRDTHMKIVGPAVYGLQRAFLVDWYFVDRTLVTGKKYYGLAPASETCTDSKETAAAAPGALMQIVTSSPTSPWPDIEQGYVRILLEAKRYVYIETPYFLPTEPVLFALRTAALAGIDVRLLLPFKGDAKLAEWASRSYVAQIVEAGVKVYLYKPGFVHSKLLVSDDTLASCGSANVDFRSFENNFEANVFIYDKPMALRLKQVFVTDMEQSVLLDDVANLEHRPFLLRLWESITRLLAPLL